MLELSFMVHRQRAFSSDIQACFLIPASTPLGGWGKILHFRRIRGQPRESYGV